MVNPPLPLQLLPSFRHAGFSPPFGIASKSIIYFFGMQVGHIGFWTLSPPKEDEPFQFHSSHRTARDQRVFVPQDTPPFSEKVPHPPAVKLQPE